MNAGNNRMTHVSDSVESRSKQIIQFGKLSTGTSAGSV